MKLTSESKFLLGILIATVTVIAGAIFLFSKPTPTVTIPKETLVPAGAHTKGNPNASVYLVEFSDFQCPACAAFAPAVAVLTEKYKDQLFFAYRHFPLPKHEFAARAAQAAEAAAKQGKFWEAVDVLFTNQDKFSKEFFSSQFVKLVSLDPTQYAKDVASKVVTDRVASDASAARSFNLPGTPTFFLNGRKLTNIQNLDQFQQIIETEIGK